MREKKYSNNIRKHIRSNFNCKIFKIVITIAVAFDMKIHEFDSINVFVNNKFNEKIFCKCFEKFRQLNKC